MRPEARRALGDVCGRPEKGPALPTCAGPAVPAPGKSQPALVNERVLKGDLQEI